MTGFYVALAVLADEILRWLLHHRTGIASAIVAATLWLIGHVPTRTTRAFGAPHPGRHLAGRDTPRTPTRHTRKAAAA